MHRRHFLQLAGTALAAGTAAACAPRANLPNGIGNASIAGAPADKGLIDAAMFHAMRRYATTPFGRIAYVERGRGDAALFLHGAPLNGFQWRGAIERLAPHRRCVAPDFMGLGYSQIPQGQSLTASDQAAMIVALLDALRIEKADFVASDSGGAVAQLLAAHHPRRVRSLLLANCDVEPDSPPPKVEPAIAMARAGTLADATANWIVDPDNARATFGKAVFAHPDLLSDETIATYATPLVSSPLRRAQYHAFHLALTPNPLAGIEAMLKRSTAPVRIVWGMSDDIFKPADADYLDTLFPRSQGVRRVPEGKLFFPEEFPDVIAEEARKLWRAA